jgi:hypothetical protein
LCSEFRRRQLTDRGTRLNGATRSRERYTSREMSPLVPFQLALLMFSGSANQHQLDVIEYLQEENRVLKRVWVAVTFVLPTPNAADWRTEPPLFKSRALSRVLDRKPRQRHEPILIRRPR